MRYIILLLILIVSAACGQISPGGEMMLTVAPQKAVDLEVTNVFFMWSASQVCGVDVHLTLRNNGDADSAAFTVSLHDHSQSIDGLPANSQTDLIFEVTGQQLEAWMRATGVIDAGNDILESDEENNAYDHPLPYSAVPGLESISMCYMTETVIAGWTETARPPTATHTNTPAPTSTFTPTAVKATVSPLAPSELPNLRLLSAQNTMLPFHCLEAVEGEFFRVLLSNNGRSDVGIFTVRIGEEDYEADGIAVDDQIYVDVPRPIGHMPGDSIQVMIDPLNAINESNENDNAGAFSIMIFTPPVRCTPAFTPSPT